LLAPAEGAEPRVVGEVGDAEPVPYLVDAGVIGPAAELRVAILDAAEPAENTIAARAVERRGQLPQLPVEGGQLTRSLVEELPYGQVRVRDLLGEVADPGPGWVFDVAGRRAQLAGEDREERRLARAVRPDQADPVGRGDGEGGVREQLLVVVAGAEVMNFPHR